MIPAGKPASLGPDNDRRAEWRLALPQVEELKLDEAHAEAIVELGIKYGAYSEDMPDTKKEKIAAAEEIIAFTIDAWVNDEVTPDDDDEEVAESGRQIAEIHEIAGIEIDEDGEVSYGDLPDLEGGEDEDEDDEDEPAEDDDEAPFDPDDYIEGGYTELSVSSKVKALKGLDAEDEEDVAILNSIREWEQEQEKPSSRVLNYIEETIGEAEVEDDDNGDDEAEDDEGDEPWEGYDKSSAVDIKKILAAQVDDEDDPLTPEQVQYVLDYEQNREKPPPRKRVIDYCTQLLEELEDSAGEDEDDEPEEEEKPKRGIAASRGRGKAKAKGKGKAKKPAKAEEDGMVTISINGDDVATLDAASLLDVVANIATEIEGGATSIALDMS
jgi:hypothetical protein